MSNAARPARSTPSSLAERFWSIARARGGSGVDGDSVDPVKVVRHVLSILDALDRGESGAPVSVRTVSFLKLLRESEQQGDLSYAAPEQITGEVLDERSLVFSVGVLLFERLTGRHPFGAEGNQVRRVARIRKGEFGSGVNYFPTVPQGLRTILMKAMGPFPEERWTNLRELRSHLVQFVEQEDTARPALPGTTAAPDRKRRTPKSDGESTRVVDMSSQVRSELLAIAERRNRDSSETSGLIHADPEIATPPLSAAKREPKVETTPLPAPQPQRRPRGGSIQEADLMPELPKPDYVPNLKPAAPAGMKPFIYVGIGAALASLMFFLLSSGGGSGTTATPAAAVTPTPAAQPETETESKPVASATSDRGPAAEAPATAATATAPAATAQAAAPAPASSGEYDPEQTGIRALSKGLPCLDATLTADGVQFGVGILVDGAGRVKKVYFAGSKSPIPFKQRKCMQAKMIGSLASDVPPTRKLVQYHARIKGNDIKVTFKD